MLVKGAGQSRPAGVITASESSASPPPSGRRTFRLFAGATLVVFGMVALAPWMIWDARRLAWDRAVQASTNQTAALAQEIERKFDRVEFALKSAILRRQLGAADPAPAANDVAPANADDSSRSIVFLDATGTIVAGDRAVLRNGSSFPTHEFFRRADAGETGFILSDPFQIPGEAGWAIAVSHPMRRADGALDGVAAVVIPLDFFARLFEAVDAETTVTLYNLDGTIIIRHPTAIADIGRHHPDAVVFRHFAGQDAGAFEATSLLNGTNRLYTFKQIGDVPLILTLSQSSTTILADWRIKAASIGLVVLGLAGVAALLGGALRAELRHRGRAELALAEKNATLSAILRELPDGVQIFDRDARLIACNEQVFQLADLSSEERDAIVQADNPGRAYRLTLARRGDYGPGDPEELVAGREETARAGRPVHFRRQSISGRWIDVRGVPTADGGWLGTYRDVTEEVAREYELRDASDRLEEQAATLCATAEDLASARSVAEQASQSKSAFLANMSHELRTPLNGVIGFADLMVQQAFGPLGNARYQEYARDIGESGRHLLELINDILDFSKADAGRLELQEDDVDLVAASSSALRMVRSRAEAAGLTIELHDRLPDGVLGARADERRIKQIVLNLVSNAIKFTPSGGRVTVTLAGAPDGDGIILAVKDTGIGIAAEDLPRVMEAFSQVDHGLNRRQNGTGLGLPLSKHLAELHDGALSIESAPGAGTAVSVWLPERRVLRFAVSEQLSAE